MKSYAIAYTKYWTNEDYVVFIPRCFLKGEYDSENKIFLDDTGEAFKSIKDYSSLLNETEFFDGVITEKELLELYDSKDASKAIKEYYLEASESIVIGKIDFENESITICELPLRRIEGLIKPIAYGIDDNGTAQVKLSKAQIQSLAAEVDINKIKRDLAVILKNMKTTEKLSNTIKLSNVVLDSTSKEVLNFSIANVGSKLQQIQNAAKQQSSVIGEDENKTLATYQYIIKRLVGQDDAVEDVVSAVINNMNATDTREMIRPFIIGPTGSGKSLLFELLGKCLDIPVISVDCNLLVQAGYEGKDINDVLRDLYHLCNGDIFKMEHAIVLFDEIDKIAAAGAGVSDVGVQQALLKFIEGNDYVVELSRFMGEKVTVNTSMMTIVAGGAFDNLTAISKNKGIGFNSSNDVEERNIGIEDLQQYGMISELLGRFNLFVRYKTVTKEMLHSALTESEISPIKIKQKFYLEHYGVTLTFNESFIERVCEEAIKNKAGFRGLNQTVNSCLSKVSFKLQCNPGTYCEVILSGDVLDNHSAYQLRKK